ncbi:MAG: hypothetical protein Q4C05_09240 [Akkermansia sp.]|nr:hypothetical protein [Akkermansia sp.]
MNRAHYYGFYQLAAVILKGIARFVGRFLSLFAITLLLCAIWIGLIYLSCNHY